MKNLLIKLTFIISFVSPLFAADPGAGAAGAAAEMTAQTDKMRIAVAQNNIEEVQTLLAEEPFLAFGVTSDELAATIPEIQKLIQETHRRTVESFPDPPQRAAPGDNG